MTKSLDLGCGRTPRNHFGAEEVFGVDIISGPNVLQADLAVEAIPYPDSFFDYVTAFDLIEHIPRILYTPKRSFPFVNLMNEIYRVLKPGGIFFSLTPAIPHEPTFADPTHVNFISVNTFLCYFDDFHCWGRFYGFEGKFRILGQEWGDSKVHLATSMQKVLLIKD